MQDLEQLKRQINAENGFIRHIGVAVTEIGEGFCRCETVLGEDGLNPHGVAHGGLLFTMCDTAAGVAATAAGRKVVSRAGDIHYLLPGRPGPLTAP